MKRLIGIGFLILVGLLGVIGFRTLTFGEAGGTQLVALPEVPEFETEKIASALTDAIQLRTQTLAAGDPRPGTEGPWLDLHALLERLYPEFHATAEKELVANYTLLYTWQGSDPDLQPILLMAHQDVVPVNIGTEGDWDAHPFSGAIQNGYLYGRGTLDDKTSLITLMVAANALVKSGFQPKRTIILLFGHDEEVSGSGAQAAVALLKSRGVRPEMVLDEGFMIVDPFPLTGKPVGIIGVAEKGYTTIRLTSAASGGHSSMPPRDSAGVQLARAIVALDENQMPANLSKPPMSQMISATAHDMPLMQKMAFANLWLFEGMVKSQFDASGEANAMIRTTTAPTMMAGSVKENVLPQQATALVNFRIHPSDTPETVLEHVRDVISELEGVSAEIDQSGGIGSPASPVSPTDNRAYAVLQAVASEAGNGAPVAPGLVLGATDARWTTEIADNVYRFAPSVVPVEDIGGVHGTNERIAVDNLTRLAHGYAQIMKAMASE
ncbi:MAG: hypothetical protein CMK07_10145 [Ponticaulis sp.]|nr:hypothetical protein [Ponticaulis sp.]